MRKRRRGEPMAVKYWSSAGLVLTWWCNARCASCYEYCGPERSEWMATDDALRWWGELAEASPHGCRVHLTGGEPMGRWDDLLELCRRAQGDLGEKYALEMVETNAFWATGAQVVRRRVRALDRAGMRRLKISTDPYHQQFVEIERCRLAAAVAEDVLGPDRVQVRWRDWLAEGFDTGGLSDGDRAALFARYAAGGRDRLCGRAADAVAPLVTDGDRRLRGPGQQVRCGASPLALTSWREVADTDCRQAVLRSRHVHVDPSGLVMPGTCAGIVLGRAQTGGEIAGLWRRLSDDHAARPIVGALARRGPAGLAERALAAGFVPRGGYASKCQLCWDVRRHLARRGLDAAELGPAWMYTL